MDNSITFFGGGSFNLLLLFLLFLFSSSFFDDLFDSLELSDEESDEVISKLSGIKNKSCGFGTGNISWC